MALLIGEEEKDGVLTLQIEADADSVGSVHHEFGRAMRWLSHVVRADFCGFRDLTFFRRGIPVPRVADFDSFSLVVVPVDGLSVDEISRMYFSFTISMCERKQDEKCGKA